MARPKYLPPAAAQEEVARTLKGLESAKASVDVSKGCGLPGMDWSLSGEDCSDCLCGA